MKSTLITVASLSLALAACSSSSPTPEVENPKAETEADTLGAASQTEGGATFTGTVSVLERDYGEDSTAGGSEEFTATLKPDEEGNVTLEVTLAGRTMTFTEDDLHNGNDHEFYVDLGDDKHIYLWNGLHGSWQDLLDGNATWWGEKYSYTAAAGFSMTDDETNPRGYFVTGMETPDSYFEASTAAATAQNATASYEGGVYADVYETTDANQSTSRDGMTGNVTLEADFSAATVSGAIDRVHVLPVGETDYVHIDGEIEINDTSITNGSFATTLTPDDAFTDGNDVVNFDSSFTGTFYGNEAQEVGGNIQFLLEYGDGGSDIGAGYWLAKKNGTSEE